MSWDNFSRFSKMKIEYLDSADTTATIYGNGLNQVAILISVLAVDSSGAPIALTTDDLYNNSALCDYRTGAKLNWAGVVEYNDEPWEYIETRNDYCNVLSYGANESGKKIAAPSSDGTVSYTFYLYSKDIADGKMIAMQVAVPDVGTFTTTESGDFPGYISATAQQGITFSTTDMQFPSKGAACSMIGQGSRTILSNTWTNYYLRFSDEMAQSHEINDQVCTAYYGGKPAADNRLFEYKQTGEWIGCDYAWADYYGQKSITVTVDIYTCDTGGYVGTQQGVINEEDGICFSSNIIYHDVLFSYQEIGGYVNVEFHDQYGNLGQVRVNHDGGALLSIGPLNE